VRQEDCWLQTLSYKGGSIWTRSFAPHHPDEWDKNPTEWLSNYDINSIMKQYDQFYPVIGSTTMDFDEKPTDYDGDCVCMCNFKVSDCIKKGIRKVGFTINLDNHESGSHWVSMFLDLDDKIIFYFDSANNPTPRAIKTFVKETVPRRTDQNYIQKKQAPAPKATPNAECIQYFLVTMLTGDIGRNS
jgi:hypothetical protein